MTGEKALRRPLALLCALLFWMGTMAPTAALAAEPATAETSAESGTETATGETAAAAANGIAMLSTSDGVQTVLDLGQGNITVYDDYASVGTQTYTDPDGYCISSVTGGGHTITIAGNAPVTLQNLWLGASNMSATPLRVKSGVNAVVTLEGSNNLGNGWDDVHTTNIVLENNAHLTLTGSGSLTCREALSKNKLNLGAGAELVVQGCSVYLRSSFAPTVEGSGTLTVDGGYLSLRTDIDNGNKLLCGTGVSVAVRNGGTLAVDEKTTNFGGKSLSLENSTLLTTGDADVNLNPGALSMVNSQINIKGTIAEALKADTSRWSGLSFEGNKGTVYGTYTLPGDYVIAAGKTLTVPQGATLTTEHAITLNGTLENDGQLNLPSQKALTGSGKLSGTGTESFALVYPEITVPTLVYNGQDRIPEISAAIPSAVTLCGKEIPVSGHTMDGWVPSYTQNGTPVTQIVEAGTYTVAYTKGDKVESKTFTVNKSDTVLDGGLQTDKADYTYGETITVTAKPVPGTTAANTLSMTAPAANQMALFLGDTQVSEPADPDAAGSYTMTVDTTLLGAGTHTLKARFVDNGNMASMEESLSVQVQQKSLRVSSVQAGSKVYDGTGEVPVTGVVLEGVLAGDDVSVDTTALAGVLPGTGAGTYSEVTLPDMTLTGADAANYTLTRPAGPVPAGTVTVTPRPVVLAWENHAFTYNGGEQYPAAAVENKGDAADEVNVTVRGGAVNASDTPYTAVASGLTGAAAANYTLTGGQNLTRTFTISKADATESKAPAANSLVYDGTAQPLVTAGEADGGTLLYSLSETGPYAETIPTAVDAGTYTVWYKVAGDANHKDTAPAMVEVTVRPADIAGAVVTPAPDSAVYTGSEIRPAVTVQLSGKTLAEGVDYTVTLNGDTVNVGDVAIQVTGTGNYAGEAEGQFAILPATPVVSWAQDTLTLTYTGSEAQIPAPDIELENGESYAGTIAYRYKAEGGTDYTDGLPVDAGTYTVEADIEAQGNYTAASGELTLTIEKADSTCTAPAANPDLCYTGEAQELVTAGSAPYGTLLYSLSEAGPYAETIPTAVDAGTYTVWYKVAGDANHKDTAPAMVEVTVERKAASVMVELSTNRLVAGEDLPTVSLTYTGLIGEESIAPAEFTLTGMPETSGTAGDYTVALSSESRAELEKLGANYALTFGEAQFTILPGTTQVLPEPEVPEAAENTIYRLEQGEVTAVPDELSDKYTSMDEIRSAMYAVAVKALPGSATENMVLHDITLLYSADDGKTWIKATAADFPAKGITVTVPYPAGTNATDYDFVVTHMVTTAVNGLKPGDVETPAVTKTEKGLRFKVYGLSPVAVSWKAIPKADNAESAPAVTPAPAATPADDTAYYTCPACGTHNWTATDNGYRCDNCGYLESGKQLSGYGNVKGTYTPGSTPAPKATAAGALPQTGDTGNLPLWGGLAVVCVLVLGGIVLYKRKRG